MIWVEPTDANAAAVLRALAKFGAPTTGVTVADLTEPEVFFQIGIDPVRIDILTSVKGLDFREAWERKAMVDFGDVAAPVLCRDDLLASGRAQDRRDAWKLRRS